MVNHIGERQSNWEPVIGLEIHAQIASKSKLFSGAGTEFAVPVNDQVSEFDASLPGTLPVINKKCVEFGILTALALKSQINLVSKFDRKHYFYADLPSGYQITQQAQPLSVGGHLDYIEYKHGTKSCKHHRAHITQIQLEQDSGKSLHDPEDNLSLIDLNRAGVGLMEIVTEPDFHTALEAASFVQELQLILQTLGTSNAKMSEGAMRVDASVSLHHKGEELGIRTEVKNINSIRFITKAIDYEINRQMKILDSGGQVLNETRNFIFETGKTVSMRDKEKLHDYRFLPDPNLPPLRLYTDEYRPPPDTPPDQVINVDHLRQQIPILPAAKREHLQKKYDISLDHSAVFINQEGLLSLFEESIKRGRCHQKFALHFILGDFLGFLNAKDLTWEQSSLTEEEVLEVIELVDTEVIPRAISLKLLEELLDPECSKSCIEIIKDREWYQINDEKQLETICLKIMEENPKKVKQFVRGKKKSINFFMGQAIRATNSCINGRKTVKVFERLMKPDRENET